MSESQLDAAERYALAQTLPHGLEPFSTLIRAMLVNAFISGTTDGIQIAKQILKESFDEQASNREADSAVPN